ncbi:hypothetical protein BJV78DRAFT_1211721 [Lactifluus subvellereus]|nr:hypothetical protein BJV78DRAFT_1211721 [Lactifluus subvellereus]
MDSSFHCHSRRASVISNANSAYSAATSTRHMLSNNMHLHLEPPTAPFSSNPFLSPVSPRTESPLLGDPALSLSVNYLPTKFSDAVLHNGLKNRGRGFQPGPKRGGGREAFRSGEARMPGDGDEDYDGLQGSFFGKEGGRTRPRLRWNRFKWTLFFSNLLFSGNRPELILSTIAAGFSIITSIIGWAGILLNNRSFLAVYTFFLWICFTLLVIPGYLTFKRRNFNLDGKVNFQWGREFGIDEWLRIQNQLNCCGFFSPFVEAAISQVCYSRSVLPGCKGPYLTLQRFILKRWYTVAFGLVPLQIGVIVVGLLCSNHITYRFGKGMMPKAYRLSMNSMAVIMDNYASQLAEQYGADVASEVLARSRSNLHLDVFPPGPLPYASGAQMNPSTIGTK